MVSLIDKLYEVILISILTIGKPCLSTLIGVHGARFCSMRGPRRGHRQSISLLGMLANFFAMYRSKVIQKTSHILKVTLVIATGLAASMLVASTCYQM